MKWWLCLGWLAVSALLIAAFFVNLRACVLIDMAAWRAVLFIIGNMIPIALAMLCGIAFAHDAYTNPGEPDE